MPLLGFEGVIRRVGVFRKWSNLTYNGHQFYIPLSLRLMACKCHVYLMGARDLLTKLGHLNFQNAAV